MTQYEIGDYLVAEINRNLSIIRTSNNDNYDEFARSKVKVLVDLLDALDEAKDIHEFEKHVKLAKKGAQGALHAIEDLLKKLPIR